MRQLYICAYHAKRYLAVRVACTTCTYPGKRLPVWGKGGGSDGDNVSPMDRGGPKHMKELDDNRTRLIWTRFGRRTYNRHLQPARQATGQTRRWLRVKGVRLTPCRP